MICMRDHMNVTLASRIVVFVDKFNVSKEAMKALNSILSCFVLFISAPYLSKIALNLIIFLEEIINIFDIYVLSSELGNVMDCGKQHLHHCLEKCSLIIYEQPQAIP